MQILSRHFKCQFPAIHIPECLLVSLFVLPSQAVSPDGEAIVTGAGDETLRFWNVFSKTRCTKVECICLLQCNISSIYSSDAFGCLKLLNSILKVILVFWETRSWKSFKIPWSSRSPDSNGGHIFWHVSFHFFICSQESKSVLNLFTRIR